MEPIFFYFNETKVESNRKFTLDFLNTELIYQINFSTENDYYITSMNCNLVIANDYGNLLNSNKEQVGCFLKKDQHINSIYF